MVLLHLWSKILSHPPMRPKTVPQSPMWTRETKTLDTSGLESSNIRTESSKFGTQNKYLNCSLRIEDRTHSARFLFVQFIHINLHIFVHSNPE